VLLGLGIQSPVVNPNVKGESTVAVSASTAARVREQRAVREMFQVKLAGIKDAGKRTIVERVQNRLTQVNTVRCDVMTRHLVVMVNILDRISGKSNELAAAGKDVSPLASAVSSARVVIEDAQSAVAAQAAKDYTITITTENALRNNVLAIRKSLETDLLAAHRKVVLARKAVSSAIRALAIVRGEPVPEAVTK
jgi:hypothetical protein